MRPFSGNSAAGRETGAPARWTLLVPALMICALVTLLAGAPGASAYRIKHVCSAPPALEPPPHPVPQALRRCPPSGFDVVNRPGELAEGPPRGDRYSPSHIQELSHRGYGPR